MTRKSDLFMRIINFALFENFNSKSGDEEHLLFFSPVEEIVAYKCSEIPAALKKLDECRQNKLNLCGYFSYKEKDLADSQDPSRALIHFTAFQNMQKLSSRDVNVFLNRSLDDGQQRVRIEEARLCSEYNPDNPLKYRFKLNGDLLSYYSDLSSLQPYERGNILQMPGAMVTTLSMMHETRRNQKVANIAARETSRYFADNTMLGGLFPAREHFYPMDLRVENVTDHLSCTTGENQGMTVGYSTSSGEHSFHSPDYVTELKPQNECILTAHAGNPKLSRVLRRVMSKTLENHPATPYKGPGASY